MSRFGTLAVILLSSLVWGQTNWCVDNPMPENKCDAHGDPATVAAGFTWHTLTDIEIATPAGSFSIERYFFSDDTNGAWYQALSLNNLPRPFSGPGTRVQWWHSLFSFVYIQGTASAWYVNGKNANQHEFQATDVGCYAPGGCYWRRFKTPGGRQMRSLSSGFIVTEEDRSVRYYEARFTASNYKYFLLSKLVTPEGAVLADITYAAPSSTVNCPASSPVPGDVAPYISTVALAGGHQLRFRYAQPGGAGSACTLSAIDYYAPGAGAGVELVSYTLASSPAGRVVNSLFRQGDAGSEAYDYSGAGFAVVRGGANRFRHQYDGGAGNYATVLSGNANWPTVSVMSQGGFPSTEDPLTVAANSCRDTSFGSKGVMLTTAMAGTAGDTSNSSTSLTTVYQTSRNTSLAHRRYRLRDTDSCGGSEACSPGENRYELRPIPSVEDPSTCADGVTVSAVRNKRGNWELTPKTHVLTLMGDGGWLSTNSNGEGAAIALAGVYRGAYEDGGKVVAPLEKQDFTYMLKSQSRYAMETKKTPSPLATADGGVVTTTYTYDDTDAGLRLTREVTSGYAGGKRARRSSTPVFASPASTMTPRPTSTRTGIATTSRRPAATSRLSRWLGPWLGLKAIKSAVGMLPILMLPRIRLPFLIRTEINQPWTSCHR